MHAAKASNASKAAAAASSRRVEAAISQSSVSISRSSDGRDLQVVGVVRKRWSRRKLETCPGRCRHHRSAVEFGDPGEADSSSAYTAAALAGKNHAEEA